MKGGGEWDILVEELVGGAGWTGEVLGGGGGVIGRIQTDAFFQSLFLSFALSRFYF